MTHTSSQQLYLRQLSCCVLLVLQGLYNELEGLQHELVQAQEQLADAQQQAQSHQQELQACREELQQAHATQAEADVAQQQLLEAQQQLSLSEQQLQAARADAEALQQQLSASEADAEAKDERIKELRTALAEVMESKEVCAWASCNRVGAQTPVALHQQCPSCLLPGQRALQLLLDHCRSAYLSVGWCLPAGAASKPWDGVAVCAEDVASPAAADGAGGQHSSVLPSWMHIDRAFSL